MTAPEIVTCSLSLISPGVCCADGNCSEQADVAALVEYARGFCEHAWCVEHAASASRGQMPDAHADGVLVATKPYRLSPVWTSGKGCS